MIAVAVFALGVYQPWTLLFSVPFLLVPFFFALEMTLADGHKDSDLSSSRFFGYFGSYYSSSFYGSYRLLRTFLLSYLIAIVGASVISSIYYAVVSSANSALAADFSALYTFISSNDVAGANDLLANSVPIITFMGVMTISEMACFGLFFVHEMGFYGLNPYLRLTLRGAPSRVANAIFVGSFRSVRPKFRKDYWSSLWMFIPLELAGFALGVYIGTLFPALSYSQIAVLGLYGGLLFMTPFIPYYLNVMALLAKKYQKAFADYSIKWAENTLNQLKQAQQISESDIKLMEKSLSDAKKAQDEGEGEDEAPKDEDQKPKDPKDYGEKK